MGAVKASSFNDFKTTEHTPPPISLSSKTIRCSILANAPSLTAPKPILCHPEAQSLLVTSPHTTAQVWDIIALKRGFPDSCDTIGNVLRTYTIRTDPAFPPFQHARCKVPIEYREQIEKSLGQNGPERHDYSSLKTYHLGIIADLSMQT